MVQGPFTVSGGQITLSSAATRAQVGLNYSWRIRGLKAFYGQNAPSVVGQKKDMGTFAFVLLDSCSFEYGIETSAEKGRDAQFSPASAHIASNNALYSGEVIYDKAQSDMGDSDPRFILKSSQPMPFTLLGIAPKLVTNAG